jgi:hypothetical protein
MLLFIMAFLPLCVNNGSFFEAHHERYENLRLTAQNGSQWRLPVGKNGESRRAVVTRRLGVALDR